VRRASFLGAVLVVAGCASIIDINQLEAPPPAVDAGPGDANELDVQKTDSADASCPTTGVVSLVLTPRGVRTALDDKDVYIARLDPSRNSAILRCSKCGCKAPTVLVDKLDQPAGIAVDDRYVFWTDSDQNDGSINRIEKNDPTKFQKIGGQESPIGVTVDADFVYWTVIGGGPKGVSTAGIWRARKADLGDATRIAAAEDLPDNLIPYAIAVDATHVYYTEAPDLFELDTSNPCRANDAGAVFGTIRRVNKAGGLQTSTVLATGQPCPNGIALDDSAVYWTNFGAGTALSGSVWTTAKASGTPKELVSKLGRPTSLAVFGGRVTWSAPTSQAVESCALPGCTDILSLARDQKNPSGLSADKTGIYWVNFGTNGQNFGDGALLRALSP
jgi:hypothetical protein